MLIIVHGATGSGKTRYLKRFVKKDGMYFHADTLCALLLQYVKRPTGEMLPPAEQLLTLEIRNFAFDDLDYQFAGKDDMQDLIFEMLKRLIDGGCDVAIGVINLKQISVLMEKVDKYYKKETEWIELL